MLSACAAVPGTFVPSEEAEPARAAVTEPQMAPAETRAVAAEPFAKGDADVTGLTPEQIDVMFAAALEQARPLAGQTAVCLAMSTDGGGWRRDPPASTLRTFATRTSLPVLPASRCAFEVFPYVIASGERAMLYTVEAEPKDGERSISFWAHAIYGNLGANGAKFILRRRGSNWYADPTGERAIS